MANFTSGNDEIINDLLLRYNFALVNDNIDDYKCVICQRLLNNACQASCGCHYCQRCADESVRGGVMFCPGDTQLCKTAHLSNIMINFQKNIQIARLIVKCPDEMCHYEKELRDMGDHLRLCGKRNVDCPFINFGCDKGKMRMDELNEHLQGESYRHNEILIGMIGNLRNEMAELKRDREKYKEIIDKLVKSDREKDAIIDLMREEMELMKMANEEEKRNEEKYRREIAERFDAVDKYLAEKFDDGFVWAIDNIAEKRQKSDMIWSEYFNGCAEPYKMRLDCHCGIEMWIDLHIDSGDNDKSLQWPFVRTVTIDITNENRRNAHKSISKHCTITNPNQRSFSDPFSFNWNELDNEELLHGDCVTVRCFIRRDG